ncbi:hypothetical protein GCM10008955_39760 [Deinococcus malanensis]|uniref:Secreted protein n=1 Tax=Deinococcus malanensis TaxID=1706855 RepID=A0ABQ2F2Y4_9DEIO|nr:hypothetical protein GCM10008955_39760 [Deinococcus malanensis]
MLVALLMGVQVAPLSRLYSRTPVSVPMVAVPLLTVRINVVPTATELLRLMSWISQVPSCPVGELTELTEGTEGEVMVTLPGSVAVPVFPAVSVVLAVTL